MTRRRVIAITVGGIALVGFACLAIGICSSLNNLGGSKGDHDIPLAGNDPLTYEQAVSIALQILALDARDVEHLQLEDVNGASTQSTSQPSDSSHTTVHYRDVKTRGDWFVTLDRKDGKVVGNSTHGL